MLNTIKNIETYMTSSDNVKEKNQEYSQSNAKNVLKENIDNISKISMNEQKKLVEETVKQFNENPIISDKLKFSFNNDINFLMVQIMDIKTDKVIRQFPSEEFIARVKYFKENFLETDRGFLIDEEG